MWKESPLALHAKNYTYGSLRFPVGNFNCDQQPHTCTCLSVSVCLFVSLSACHGFSAMFLLSDLHDSYTRYSSHALLDLYSPLSGCLCVFSSSIYPSATAFSIMFLLWDLNDSNTRYSCHELLVECAFSVQFHVKVAQVIRRFRSVPMHMWRIGFIFSANTTHEVTMGRVTCPDEKRSTVEVQRVVRNFAMSAM